MTTAITTIQRAAPKRGVHRFARRFRASLADFGDRIAAWSAPYYRTGIGEQLEAMSPSEQLDAALRWHARHGHML